MIPLPSASGETEAHPGTLSPRQIDEASSKWYELSEVDIALVEDFCEFSLTSFRSSGSPEMPARAEAWSEARSSEKLEVYCSWFLRVLQSGFGSGSGLCATIFRPPDPGDFPFCMVGIHLDWERSERIQYEDVADGDLLGALEQCAQDGQPECLAVEAIYYRRVSRIYQTLGVEEGGRKRSIPTVFLIKPNQLRYWTRSVALRDADNVVADLVKHSTRDSSTGEASLG